MKNTLRTLVLTSMVLATAAFTTTSIAKAETLNVPFNFTAAGKDCPKGVYQVERKGLSNVVTLKNQDGSHSFTLVLARSADVPTTKIALRFEEQGDHHILRSVQYRGFTTAQLTQKEMPAPSYAAF